jgi:hypothetical protein
MLGVNPIEVRGGGVGTSTRLLIEVRCSLRFVYLMESNESHVETLSSSDRGMILGAKPRISKPIISTVSLPPQLFFSSPRGFDERVLVGRDFDRS